MSLISHIYTFLVQLSLSLSHASFMNSEPHHASTHPTRTKNKSSSHARHGCKSSPIPFHIKLKLINLMSHDFIQ